MKTSIYLQSFDATYARPIAGYRFLENGDYGCVTTEINYDG